MVDLGSGSVWVPGNRIGPYNDDVGKPASSGRTGRWRNSRDGSIGVERPFRREADVDLVAVGGRVRGQPGTGEEHRIETSYDLQIEAPQVRSLPLANAASAESAWRTYDVSAVHWLSGPAFNAPRVRAVQILDCTKPGRGTTPALPQQPCRPAQGHHDMARRVPSSTAVGERAERERSVYRSVFVC